MNGRQLNFHLAGINNQNFIMRDEETGSWWQQVTGEAVLGPLKGQRLKPVAHDELTFALWKREAPQGRVLKPDEKVAAAGDYVPANWEERMVKVPVTTTAQTDQRLEPRTLVVGLELNGAAKAYPFNALQKQSPVIDTLGGVPILIVMDQDQKSVRAYERTLNDRRLEFFARPDATPLKLIDTETGSAWDFSGRATDGPLAGQQLRKLSVLNDYWFDWQTYHPHTAVYTLGQR